METKYHRQYYLENIEKIKLNHKKWLEANPAYYKEYYAKNIEKRRQTCRESSRRYRAKNRDKIRISQILYRSKNGCKSPWFKRITQRDGELCKLCSLTEGLTLQHKIPKCVGGKDSYENLEILCLKCNMAEYHKLVKKALIKYFTSN